MKIFQNVTFSINAQLVKFWFNWRNNALISLKITCNFKDDDDQYDEVMGRLVMDMEEEDEEIDLDAEGQVKVCNWIKRSFFQLHCCPKSFFFFLS